MQKKFLGVIAALTVGACATPYVATPYERDVANIHVIAIVDDSMPPKLSAWEAASVGSNFGLIGALADAGVQNSREDALTEALAGVSFDAEAVLEARIASKLAERGYQAALLPGADREEREFVSAYAQAPEGTDAYLDVVVTNYGYLSAGAFQPWRPTVTAEVRLVHADGNATLMENKIAYNTMYVQEGVITISANPEYEFQNRDAMLSDPSRLAAGIEDALNQVADTAIGLLQ